MIVGVVIPVFNERKLLPRLLERLMATPSAATRRVYIVDDGSTDGTRAWLDELAQRGDARAHIHVLLHATNRGKGAAVRSGVAAALADKVDVVLIQDGDLEYDPRDHERLLLPIADGRADAVIGSRFLGEAHRVLYYWHYLANRCVTTLSNMFTNLNLSDIECCLKAMTREVAEQVKIEEDRFGVEPEIVAKLAKVRVRRSVGGVGGVEGELQEERARVYEVAVTYAGRTYAEGKKITWRDGFDALRCIVKYGMRG